MNTEADAEAGSQNSALERCLEVLKSAKNDSEQFAALLLVTKCAQANDLDCETRCRIFDAVGFSFPNRLLFSKTIPDGCPDHLFRSLGLTLLACFCTVPSLAAHPQVLNKIPILNDTIHALRPTDSKDVTSMVEDAYQCLVGILTSPQGAKHLVSGGTVSVLSQAYLNQSHGWNKALKILTALLTSVPERCWKKSGTDCHCLLVRLSEEFVNEEDSRKFHLLEILPIFLPPSSILLEASWGINCLKNLCKGLFKILSTKLSISQRDPALKLGACLSHMYGSAWIRVEGKGERARFLCLLVNLACVEIRMALEDPDPLESRQSSVTACYALVEMGIQECTKEEGRPMLGEQQKLQLLQVMQEACGAVMYYLQQVGWDRQEDPFVLASVRLLGVWLAEETSCLRQEVIQLLPFLVHYMRTWFGRGVFCKSQPKEVSQVAILSSSWGAVWPGDAIRFLLPALCHLTAEEAPRRILISEGVPALLCEYYQQQWEVFSNEELSKDAKHVAELSLQSCCGVFLNLVVTEPVLIGQENCFLTLLKLLMQSLPVQLSKEGHLILVANISTLSLMMSRFLTSTAVLQESSSSHNFFLAVIQFLSHSHVSSTDPDTGKQHIALQESYADVWEDISELWYLGVQSFYACLPLLPWLSALVLKSGWIQDLMHLLDQVLPDSVDLELVKVIQALLIELAIVSVPCREFIQQKGGIEKANVYGMAALEQCLSEIS